MITRREWATGGRRRQRGSTIVEFALVAIVFFALVIGILNGVWFVAASSAVTNAAREGARHGIIATNGCTSASVTSAAKAQLGPYSNVTVSATQGSDGDGTYCQVSVTSPYTPFAGAWPFSTFTIASTANEYLN